MATIEKTVYRPKEAAAYASIGLSTLWVFIKQGRIKARKISERITVIDKTELDAFLNGEV